MRWPITGISLIALMLFVIPARAADFHTAVNSIYSVSSSRQVSVHQTVTITNTTDLKYPKQYSFSLPSARLEQLKIVGDKNLSLTSDIKPVGDLTQVTVQVPPVIGQGKTQTLTLDYVNPDVLVSEGKIIELAIPALGFPADEAGVIVMLPASLCPEPSSDRDGEILVQGDVVSLKFARLSMDQSVFVRCQTKRHSQLTLKYFLSNTNMTPIETQIALPPDTPHQQLIFDAIEPAPLSVATDTDNNVLATFRLEPKADLNVTVHARVMMHLTPNPVFKEAAVPKHYLAPEPKWPAADSDIRKLAANFGTVQGIYHYILTHSKLTGDAAADPFPQRDGKAILTHPESMNCHEIVDAFIALTRAIGIPARRLVGHANAANAALQSHHGKNNPLHVWTEYYDAETGGWRMVDPVWEMVAKTGYFPVPDLNHLVLAVNGTHDTNPYPVGYYHAPGNDSPDLTVTDLDPFTVPDPALQATITPSVWSRLGLNPVANLTVVNQSNRTLYQTGISLHSNETLVLAHTFDRLPLHGQGIIPITLPKSYGTLTLTTTNGHRYPVGIDSHPLATPVAVAGLVAGIAGLLAVITRRLLVSRQ